jgi:hypothetical protein
MDSKIKILFLLLFCPILLFAQTKATKKYMDSSELQLKLFAAEYYYSVQREIADSASNKASVDYFMQSYFQNSNYEYDAIKQIWAFAKQEAHKDFFTEERAKCLCYTSSLLFFTSDKLNRKVKSLRKYLSTKAPQ